MKKQFGITLSGLCAGAVNGLFGAGGGMVLIPLSAPHLKEEEVFPSSVCIILPICLVSLVLSNNLGDIPGNIVLPYLAGSAAGGLAAGFLGKKIPTLWLHRSLGILILWGGIRYLW